MTDLALRRHSLSRFHSCLAFCSILRAFCLLCNATSRVLLDKFLVCLLSLLQHDSVLSRPLLTQAAEMQ